MDTHLGKIIHIVIILTRTRGIQKLDYQKSFMTRKPCHGFPRKKYPQMFSMKISSQDFCMQREDLLSAWKDL